MIGKARTTAVPVRVWVWVLRIIMAPVQLVRPKPKPANPTVMFDSVDLSQIPTKAPAIAGYVGGWWPTYHELGRLFPKARRLSVAVNAREDADCLDIENGDAVPSEAPGWVRRQQARGVTRPCLYASLSSMTDVVAALQAAGVKRQEVRLWVAHWTGIPHIPVGYDGCQWTQRAFGLNLDESVLLPSFFS